MAEGLSTLDGEALDLDATEARFAAAMAAPPADKPGMTAPARKPPKPAEDPEAAPFGWMYADGEWRAKKAPGRQRTASEARVTDAPPKPPAKSVPSKPDKPKADYRKTVKETCEAVWFVLATLPVPGQMLGVKLDGVRTKLRVQAALIEQNTDGLSSGLNVIGQHNRFVGNALARMAAGEGGLWVLPACMLLAPFVAGTAQLWGSKLDGVDLDAIAANTEAAAALYVQQLAEATAQQG